MESSVLLAVQNRQVLTKQALEISLSKIATSLLSLEYGEKLRVALELYAAHFNEQQVRVRFLLIVIAMESSQNQLKRAVPRSLCLSVGSKN